MATAEQQAYSKAYYAANRDAVKARVRAYAASNKEAIRERGKAYRTANKEKLRARQKAYYEAHKEERIAYQKSLHASKPDKVKAYKQEWWAKNREAFSAKRTDPACRARERRVAKVWYHANYSKNREKFLARIAKRRALKTTTNVEPIDYVDVLRASNGVCGICKKSLDLFGVDFDHIVPLSRGGTHTRENLQATHSSCNRSKGARVA
jgi:5-methylcytosine-specific restriction endonuclease McrA